MRVLSERKTRSRLRFISFLAFLSFPCAVSPGTYVVPITAIESLGMYGNATMTITVLTQGSPQLDSVNVTSTVPSVGGTPLLFSGSNFASALNVTVTGSYRTGALSFVLKVSTCVPFQCFWASWSASCVACCVGTVLVGESVGRARFVVHLCIKPVPTSCSGCGVR